MRPTSEFAVEPMPAREDQPVRSRLRYRDQQTMAILDGAVLEAQASLGDGRHCLLLTDDCPFEEGVHAYLLDAGFEVIARKNLGAPYTPGIVQMGEIGEAGMEFQFAGERFRLSVEGRKLALTRLESVR